MVAIVVILAAVVGMMAFGFEGELEEPSPTGSFEFEFVPSGEDNTEDRPYVTVTHQAGRPIPAEDVTVRDESGNSISWANVWTGNDWINASESVHLDGFQSDGVLDPICEEGHTYTVVVHVEDGTNVVTEWTAPTDPDLAADSSFDDDGVPDWC